MIVEGFISGLHKSPYRGFAVEFAEHREYVPGDDVRHIDWRVYAKADRYYVKQYEQETNLRAYIVLDASRSMAYPEHPDRDRMTKWEYAATAAASLAYLLIHQQDAAGLLLFDEDIRQELAPTSNAAQLRTLIEVIERNQPDLRTEVKVVFDKLADRLKKKGLVVIISDLLADPDEVINGLRHFAHDGHDVIVLHVLDHDELELPFVDNTLFEGLEAPELELLTDPQSLRRSYLEGLRRFITRIRGACVDRRIDYVLLSTRDPLDVALTRFLASRMHAMKAS